MIIVTGAAGFIGSNIIRALNACGRHDIVAVDNLENGRKFDNLLDLVVLDYWDADVLERNMACPPFGLPSPSVVIHQGACADTMEWNGRHMLQLNFELSKRLLHFCLQWKISFIYASSAAVYGSAATFDESPQNERPLNVYGYSKLLFDRYVRQRMASFGSQVVGLRYFNVYGPGERHKGVMASVAWHFREQLCKDGVIKLFEGTHGYEAGEQRRDFVYVDDVADVVRWFYEHPNVSGIYNVGTGRGETFNAVAGAVLKWQGSGRLEYVPFPEHLKGRYQAYTRASLTRLRETGCPVSFRDVATGVGDYMAALDERAT